MVNNGEAYHENAAPFSIRSRINDVINTIYQMISLFWMALGKNREPPATYIQFVTLKRSLTILDESGVYTLSDISPYETRFNELKEILERTPVQTIPGGLKLLIEGVSTLCENLLNKLKQTAEALDPILLPIQTKLVELRNKLSSMVVANADDSNNEEILAQLQRELREIDGQRENGKFVAPDGTIPKGQAQLIGLLEECYENIHDLMATRNKTMSNEIQPIYDKLTELRGQLQYLLSTHRWTCRETDLWQYQQQLQEVSNLPRRNGQFVNAEGEVIPGQAVLHYLLQRCYRLLNMLYSASEPIAESLIPIYNQLFTVRRFLIEIRKLDGVPSEIELFPLQMKLGQLDDMRVNGKFVEEDGTIPEGQAIVMSLLNECYDRLFELQAQIPS
ncbi:hypothetical protein BDF22DRAFT_620019 [Syncephalis plumigaleata]|nr:hypothetical protein BDF22DRAFT_620019 [Syncephalis plumigaleata]